MKNYYRTISLLVMISLLAACVPGMPGSAPAWTDVKDSVWWKDSTFYEIYVRSFYDSNADGIGDIKGITQKLDYLNDGKPETTSDLGVTGIWLMPVNPSPSIHGYDVTDYYEVNPQYGTLADMKELVSEAHKRGIRVIIDLVLNHTSVQHPWFQAANNGDPKYRDWYIWSETDPGYQGPWGEQVWYPGNKGYFYSIFDQVMADLNYNNPEVVAEMNKVAQFWLKDVGIDGFRLDAAKHIIEDGRTQENTPATHAYLKDFSDLTLPDGRDALVVGEVQQGTEEIANYVNNNELDLVFNFGMAADILKSAANGNSFNMQTALANAKRVYQPGRSSAPFLTNHDQPRAMTVLIDDAAKMKNAASLMLTAPGVPFLYYGEEIGMTGNKPDPNIRAPFQWTDGPNAGMTGADFPYRMVNDDYKTKNVAVMEKDPQSILSHYKALIKIRSEHYALRSGQYVEVSSPETALFAALRVAEKEAVLVLVNLGTQPIAGAALSWNASGMKGASTPVVLMGKSGLKAAPPALNETGGVKGYVPVPSIDPGETIILQLLPKP